MRNHLYYILLLLFVSCSDSGNTSMNTESVTHDQDQSFDGTNEELIDPDLTMTDEDFEYVKSIIQEDVINWCYKTDPKLEPIAFKMWMLQLSDTIVPITIQLDTGVIEIDLVEEFNRRLVGGFAGSYPFAQSWEFKITEDNLIDIIKDIKTDYPELQVPNDTSLTSGKSSYWHFIDFYDIEKNEIISTWVRESDESIPSTSFALVSYTTTKDSMKSERKLINKDYWFLENKNRIKSFEKLIVDKVNMRIKN